MFSQICSTFLITGLLFLVATNVARSQRSPGKKGRTTPIPVTPSATPLAEIDLTDPEHFRDDGAKCVEIPANMTLCKGIGYTQMRLPNLFHQQTLTEVTREASTWTPLLASQCHPDAQLFLCSLFSPVCFDQPIWPCKSLCEQVKRGCEPRLAAFGFPWPNMLNCDKFPSNKDLCIALQHNKKSNSTQTVPGTTGQQACNACRKTESMDDLRSSYCAADFAAKINAEETELADGELKIKAAKKVKYYKRPNSVNMRKSKPTFHLQNFSDCDCYDLANITQNGNKAPYFVIGKVDTNSKKMTLTYVQKLDKQAAAIKKSMRIFTKGKSCNNLAASSTVSTATEKPEEFTTEKSKAECKAERKRNKNKLKKKNRDQKNKNNQDVEIEEDIVIEAESVPMKKNKKQRIPNEEMKNKPKNDEVRQQGRANKKAKAQNQ